MTTLPREGDELEELIPAVAGLAQSRNFLSALGHDELGRMVEHASEEEVLGFRIRGYLFVALGAALFDGLGEEPEPPS